MKRWDLAATLAATCVVLVLAPAASAQEISCQGDPSETLRLDFETAPGESTYAYYALPAGSPRGLLVLDHGYAGTAEDLYDTVAAAAELFGVIAVAPEYRGTIPPGPGQTRSRGYPVIAGAEDTIAVTRRFADACPDAQPVVALGFSMGGEISGVAVASGAAGPGGRPLFDYWFDVAGVMNLSEEYWQGEAVLALQPGTPNAAEGLADIRAETGGTPSQRPDAYRVRSPVNRAAEMKASGLKGAVITHSAMDGYVTGDQAVQMGVALLAAGVPAEGYAVLTKSPGAEPDEITLDGRFLAALIPDYDSPFAGHISQTTYLAAYERLGRLLAGEDVRYGIGLIDGLSGLRPELRPKIG